MFQLHIEGGGAPRDETFTQETLTLGRAADNDVVLTDDSVSLHHARIWRENMAIHVEDLGSRLGTRVASRLLNKAAADVSPGEAIAIGVFMVRVGTPYPPPTPLPAPASAKTVVPAASPRPVLVFETPGGGFTAVIDRDEVTIGRAAGNDVVLSVPTVSSHHAVVRRLGDRWEIVDLQSSNGTHVDGARIEEALLKDGQRFTLADVVGVTFHFVAPPALTAQSPLYVPPAPADLPLGGTAAVGGEEVEQARAALREAPAPAGPAPRQAGNSARGASPLGGRGRSPGSGAAARPAPQPVQSVAPAAPDEPAPAPEPAGVLLEALGLRREVDKGKVILQNVSLVVRPHEFVAVVGGSGAGKSTLLGALCGFRPATAGQVLLNGVSLYDHFDALRDKIGYVPQDDIIHRELPVERALSYAAELRLPAELTPAARAARVSEVIGELGLEQQRQTIVSSLSGGQRKRVSIGVELLTSPPLFFLDEPTSGLDPGTETRMMALLRQLADQGRTVLLITHATRNVSMCDRVLFLARGGRIAFYGPPRTALDYFGVREFEDIYDLIENQRTPEDWEATFAASPLYQSEIAARIEHPAGAALAAPPHRPAAALAPGQVRPQNESLRQFKILTRRYADIVLHDRKNLAILLLQAPIIAVLLWALFTRSNMFQPPPNPVLQTQQGSIPLTPQNVKLAEQQLRNNRSPRGQGQNSPPPFLVFTGRDCGPRVAGPDCHQDQGNGNGNASEAARLAFILAATAVWLGTLNAIREISKEDAIYRRERLVSLRVFPYIASKFAVLLALVAVQATLLFGVADIRIGFPAGSLPGVWLSLLLGGAASVAVALAVSAAVSNPDRAVFAAPLIMLPQIFFAGLLVAVDKLGPAQPLAALTTARWTFEAAGRAANLIDAAALPPVFLYHDALDGGAWSRWLILLGFVAGFGALAVFLQKLKDRR